MRACALAVCLAPLLALPAAAPAAVSTGGTGWLWANPLPQGRGLDAVTFVGARGVAVGVDAKLRRSTVFVAQWRGVLGVQGDGTAPLRLRVGRHKRR
jgi:hypothetical protein